MRKKTPRTKIVFIVVLTLLFSAGLAGLTGCGPQQAEPVTITMVAGTVGKEFEVLQDQVTQFEAEHPEIKVQLIDPPESTNDRYETYVELFKQEDSSIDVYMIDIIWQPEFGAAGWTIPLNDYVAAHEIDMDDMIRGSVLSNTWQGKLVSMPWFTDAGQLFYRKDLLEKYGFAAPETWSELQEAAEVIMAGEKENKPNMVGFVFQGRQYEGLVTNYLEYVWGNGADVLDFTSRQVVLDSPEAIEALEILVDMQNVSAPGIASFQEPDALNYFRSGNAVFMRNWPFAWGVLSDDPAFIKKVGVAPLPRGPHGEKSASALGGWQLAISAYSEHPDEAFELIAFLVSPEQQAYKAIHAGQAPTRLSTYDNPDVLAANPYFEILFDVLVNAQPRPIHPRYHEISEIIQAEVYQAMTGQQAAAVATEKMAAAIQEVIDSSDQEESP